MLPAKYCDNCDTILWQLWYKKKQKKKKQLNSAVLIKNGSDKSIYTIYKNVHVIMTLKFKVTDVEGEIKYVFM